jgi:hypothetical protein
MADSNTIGSGTAAGAVQYLDFLSNRGHLTTGSVKALKTGFTKVIKTLGGNEWESIDVRSIDIDEYMIRFANMTHGQYNAASLTDYKSRVKKVLSWYAHFLSTPGWVPDVKSRMRNSKASKDSATVTQTLPLTSEAPLSTTSNLVIPSTTLSKLVAFPFPLSDGTLANLYLPPSINASDAKRMARFIETLVIEEVSNE